MLIGTVHQMYECVSEVLLHLGRMFGIVFMVQRGQIWPKNVKTCMNHGHCSKSPRALLKVPMVHFLKTRFFRFLAKFEPSEP